MVDGRQAGQVQTSDDRLRLPQGPELLILGLLRTASDETGRYSMQMTSLPQDNG